MCIHINIYIIDIYFYICYCVITLSWLCELCIYTPLPAEQVCLGFSPHYTSHKYQLTPLQRAGLGIKPSSRGVSLHHSGAIISRSTSRVERCSRPRCALRLVILSNSRFPFAIYSTSCRRRVLGTSLGQPCCFWDFICGREGRDRLKHTEWSR